MMNINGWLVNGVSSVESGMYVLATLVDDELWYYGAFDNEEQALMVAERYDKVFCGRA